MLTSSSSISQKKQRRRSFVSHNFDKEFEILVGHLLTALGFEGSEVTGKTGDGGVGATGVLNVSNLAKVSIFVQAKRYKLGTNISAATVRQLRQAIPFGDYDLVVVLAFLDRVQHRAGVGIGDRVRWAPRGQWK